VFARRYDAAGVARGESFRVNNVTAFGSVAVAMDADGDFVVSWDRPDVVGFDTTDVYARRFNSAGVAQGNEFRVNSVGSGWQNTPSVAMTPGGEFIVGWKSHVLGSIGSAIMTRRFDNAGKALGGEVRVSNNAFDNGNPSVALDAEGDFVVTWGTAYPSQVVYARRFDGAGVARGDEFVVGDGGRPSLSMSPSGDFVIVWGESTGTAPAQSSAVYGLRYDPAGVPRGDRFTVAPPTQWVYAEGVAMDAEGDLVVALRRVDRNNLNVDVTARQFGESRPPSVAGRHTFYDGSAFDAGGSDDAAIATDKSALRPGQAATFANVTSYSLGINGVMVDLLGLPSGAALTADDFSFRWGRSADGSDFADGPIPASVTVRPGEGSGGSDRVTLAWGDDAVRNGWLEVTVKATGDTGLAAPDVFRFGNLVGDTGDSVAGPFRVNALDIAAVKRALNTGSTLTGRFDFDRDGRVSALDLAVVRANLNGALTPLAAPLPLPSAAPLPLRRVWDEVQPSNTLQLN
jgi:hypothetical protein